MPELEVFAELLELLDVKSVLVLHPDPSVDGGSLENHWEAVARKIGSQSGRKLCRLPGLNGTGTPIKLTPDQSNKELVYVSGLFELSAFAEPMRILARLRDDCQGQLVVEVPRRLDTNGVNRSDFFALGFSELRPGSRYPDFNFYRYSLRDYKTTPDWFNSRYWANPERWDID